MSDEHEPEDGKRRAPPGPRGSVVSVDELVAHGHTVIDRVRSAVERARGSLRARLTRK